MGPTYQYKAIVVHVVDGDTIDVDIDLGFYIAMKRTRLRVARIDTPEIRGHERPQGLKAKARVEELVMNREVIIETEKKGKYGRYLAEVYYWNGQRWMNLSNVLIAEGHAKMYD